jgi:hypothetical protein
MLARVWYCSDTCKNFIFEIENYIKDEKDRIPKENDHLIDCARYTNGANYYSMAEVREPESKDPFDLPRFKKMSDDIKDYYQLKDWTRMVLGDDYGYDD